MPPAPGAGSDPESSAGADPAVDSGGGASLGARARRSSLWVLLGLLGSQLMRLGGNVVLARLLFEEAFGLMALLALVIQGLSMFSDVGIGPGIVHSKRGDDPVYLNTAWTVQVLRGIVLWIAAALLAGPIAWFYGEPELAVFLPIAALVTILGGLNSTRYFTAERHLALGKRVRNDFLAHAASVVVMILWASFSATVWALVAGQLMQAAVLALTSHLALPGSPNRPKLERAALSELVHFGRWIFVSTLIAFLAMGIDRLMLGRLEGLALLGVYSVAWGLVSTTYVIGGALAGNVQFPLLAAQARMDRGAMARRFLETRVHLLAAARFACLGFLLLGPAFFALLYDERWQAAGWITQLLAIASWFGMLQLTSDRACLALGDTRSLAASNAASLCVKIAAGLVGLSLAGLPGFVLGMALGSLAGHLVIQRALARLGIPIAAQDLAASARFALYGSVALVPLFAGLDGSARTLLEIALAAAVLGPAAWGLRPLMHLGRTASPPTERLSP